MLLWAAIATVVSFLSLGSGRAISPLCLHQQNNATHDRGFTDGELVEYWMAEVDHNSRLFSVFNRPEAARLVFDADQSHPGKKMRPKNLGSHKENVSARVDLRAINDIDEKDQYFTADGYLVMQWKDSRLCFDGSDWGDHNENEQGCSCIPAHTQKPVCDCCCAEEEGSKCHCIALRGQNLANVSQLLWIPDVYISNTASATEIQTDVHEQLLTVSMDGWITWRYRFIKRISCEFDLIELPFDHQLLGVELGAFGNNVHLRWINGKPLATALKKSEPKESKRARHGPHGVPQGWSVCDDHKDKKCKKPEGDTCSLDEEGRYSCTQYQPADGRSQHTHLITAHTPAHARVPCAHRHTRWGQLLGGGGCASIYQHATGCA
jgi:hypothetical protein